MRIILLWWLPATNRYPQAWDWLDKDFLCCHFQEKYVYNLGASSTCILCLIFKAQPRCIHKRTIRLAVFFARTKKYNIAVDCFVWRMFQIRFLSPRGRGLCVQIHFAKLAWKYWCTHLLNDNHSGFTFHYGIVRVFWNWNSHHLPMMKELTGKETNQFPLKIVNNSTAGYNRIQVIFSIN